MSRRMTTSEAINEARRCLNCARPLCRTGCPIENNIPQFIRALSEGNIGLAYEIISERSNLPAICGRVCPHERQCEAHCVLAKNKHGIEIGSLEMFIADFAHENNLKPLPPSTGKRGKVAVIGSGPAGLTVAGDLAKMNFAVTIFEGQSEPGGILLFGIPEFRLNKDVVRREIKELLHLGVEIKTNTLIGPDYTVDDLFNMGYDAIFMGTGTSLPRTLNIPGKELTGILTATYFLRMVVLSDSGKLDESETLLHVGDNVIVSAQATWLWMPHARQSAAALKMLRLFTTKRKPRFPASPPNTKQPLKKACSLTFCSSPLPTLTKNKCARLTPCARKLPKATKLSLQGFWCRTLLKRKTGSLLKKAARLPCRATA